MTELSIEGRRIAPGGPTFVIAEIGVNHDGSLFKALELVEAAAKAGADAVKLQIFRAATLMHESSAFAAYQRAQCADADPAAMLRRYELSAADLAKIVAAIRARGLVPLATPFSPADVDVLRELDLPAVKIASPDLVNRPLLRRAAALGKPMLLSTGAATLSEIDATTGWLAEWGASFALLHCVSAYPTPAEQANLCWIGELAPRYGVPVGYSDHTDHLTAGALAMAAGACVIEKHLTHDRSAAGPDHAASADACQFAEYVKLVREAERLRGSPGKRVLDIEQDVRRVSRQSLVLARSVGAGQVLREDDLTVQRPGGGISAADEAAVVGRVAKCPLMAGTMLQWDMLGAA